MKRSFLLFSILMSISTLSFAQQSPKQTVITWQKVNGEKVVIEIVKDQQGNLLNTQAITIAQLMQARIQLTSEYQKNDKELKDAIDLANKNDSK